MRWEAILLAGGKLEKDFEALGNYSGKAYLPIAGKPMAQYVIEVLQNISKLKRIVSVIPPGGAPWAGTTTIPGGDSIIKSMAAGFKALNPDTEMALLVTCDLPCLTQESIEDFMTQVENSAPGLAFGFVSRQDSEAKFPGVPHTYLKVREGTFCGSGLIAVKPSDFSALQSFAAEATQNRKNLFKIVKILGVKFILKLLLRMLTLKEAEARASRLLGFPAKGIRSHFPEIAFNVDDLLTLNIAKKIMTQQLPTALGPYRLAVPAGDFVFVSGQVGVNANGDLIGETVEAQTKQALENLKAILESQNLKLSNVVKTTIYLTNMGDFGAMNKIYAEYFTNDFPARATVGIQSLPKNARVEIEAIAIKN